MSRPAAGNFSRLNGTSKSFGFFLLKDNNDSREGRKAPRQGRVREQATMTVEKTGRRRAGPKAAPVAMPGLRWPADAVERRAVAAPRFRSRVFQVTTPMSPRCSSPQAGIYLP